MPSLKYGCITPNAKGREYPVAASQYFHRSGAAFVYLDSSGYVTLALTATATLFGYAIVPDGVGAGAAGSAYWLSSATAAADRLFVITDPDAEFVIPFDAAVTAAQAGDALDLISVNDGTAQTGDYNTGSTDVLIVQGRAVDLISGGGYATTDAVVKINPAKRQAD